MALVYLDDTIDFVEYSDKNLKRLELVRQCLGENGLKTKGSECNFLQKSL